MKELKEKFMKRFNLWTKLEFEGEESFATCDENVWQFIDNNFVAKEVITEQVIKAMKSITDSHRKEERDNIIRVIEGLMEAYRIDEPNPSVIGAFLLLINKIETKKNGEVGNCDGCMFNKSCDKRIGFTNGSSQDIYYCSTYKNSHSV